MSRPQATRAAQFEKEDLLKNYRGLHAEKRRLEAGMDELQLARQRLTKVCDRNTGFFPNMDGTRKGNTYENELMIVSSASPRNEGYWRYDTPAGYVIVFL